MDSLKGLYHQAPPRTISPDLRNKVYRDKTVIFVVAIFFVIIGSMLTISFAPWGLVREIALDLNSTVTSGIVLGFHDTGMSQNDEEIYLIEFEFEDSDHIRHRGKCYSRNPMVIGMEVVVEHSTTEFDIARIRGCSANPGGYFGALVIFFPVIGIFVFLYAVAEGQRQLNLLAKGTATEGLVERTTRCSPKPVCHGYSSFERIAATNRIMSFSTRGRSTPST